MQSNLKRQKLILGSLLLLVLLSYPLISIFNKPVLAGGFPILYLYIFGVWITTIIILYRVSDKKEKKNHE
jgi:hypothetical protein